MNIDYKKLDEKVISIKHKKHKYPKEILVKEFELPNGKKESFFVEKRMDSTCIFGLTEDKQVLLVKQYRPGPEEICKELPGGGVEYGEDLNKSALRELEEETGYTSDNVKYLCSLQYNPYSSGKKHCFLATDCKKSSKQDLDENEFINVELMGLDEFRKEIKEGKVRGIDVAYIAMDNLGIL